MSIVTFLQINAPYQLLVHFKWHNGRANCCLAGARTEVVVKNDRTLPKKVREILSTISS